MKNFKLLVLSLLLALVPLVSACKSGTSTAGPRLGVEVQVSDGVGVIAFARSAPLQDVTIVGIGSQGGVRVLDLTTGLTLFEGVAEYGQVLVVTHKGVTKYAHGAVLPMEDSVVFSESELERPDVHTAVAVQYGLTFQDSNVPAELESTGQIE